MRGSVSFSADFQFGSEKGGHLTPLRHEAESLQKICSVVFDKFSKRDKTFSIIYAGQFFV